MRVTKVSPGALHAMTAGLRFAPGKPGPFPAVPQVLKSDGITPLLLECDIHCQILLLTSYIFGVPQIMGNVARF